MTIYEIEALTQKQAEKMALSKKTIKEHEVYFVNTDDYFGYSALVFKNGRMIKYANLYQLHYPSKKPEELEAYFTEMLEHMLFTCDEFDTVSDYDDYSKKDYFLRNYMIEQIPHVSIFQFFKDEKEKKAHMRKIKNMIYDNISFCYVEKEYLSFIERQQELSQRLEAARKEHETDYDYLYKAFLKEMYNHEYAINWQGDYDVMCAFGNVEWHEDDLEAYFKELSFNETKKRAYMDARKKCLAASW